MKYISIITFLIIAFNSFAQNGVIKSKVFNSKNNEAIPFDNVVIQGTTIGATINIDFTKLKI